MPQTTPAPTTAEALRDYARALLDEWQALVIGFAFTFATSILPTALHKVVPQWLWGVGLIVMVLPASFLAWRKERREVYRLEDERRARERAAERQSMNVPTAFQRGRLAALVNQVAIPKGLDQESSTELDRLIGKAVAGLGKDCLYIIERERTNARFGPWEEPQRGRYGRMKWEDVRAEVKRLQLLGLVDRATDGNTIFLQWSPFGYAVLGKLAASRSR